MTILLTATITYLALENNRLGRENTNLELTVRNLENTNHNMQKLAECTVRLASIFCDNFSEAASADDTDQSMVKLPPI